MEPVLPAFFKPAGHRAHAKDHADVGVGHVKIKHRPVRHLCKAKIAVKQMMMPIGQKHQVVKGADAEQQKFCPNSHGFPAVKPGKQQPAWPDQADSYIGNAVEGVFYCQAGGVGQKQLGKAPDNNKELAHDKGLGGTASFRPEHEPPGRIEATPDGPQVSGPQQRLRHSNSPFTVFFSP